MKQKAFIEIVTDDGVVKAVAKNSRYKSDKEMSFAMDVAKVFAEMIENYADSLSVRYKEFVEKSKKGK